MYFGTDGIRGVTNAEITPELCFRAGNALAQMGAKKIVIGRDTRTSGDLFAVSLASGAMAGGCGVRKKAPHGLCGLFTATQILPSLPPKFCESSSTKSSYIKPKKSTAKENRP